MFPVCSTWEAWHKLIAGHFKIAFMGSGSETVPTQKDIYFQVLGVLNGDVNLHLFHSRLGYLFQLNLQYEALFFKFLSFSAASSLSSFYSSLSIGLSPPFSFSFLIQNIQPGKMKMLASPLNPSLIKRCLQNMAFDWRINRYRNSHYVELYNSSDLITNMLQNAWEHRSEGI